MARLLLNLQNIHLTFGGKPVLEGAELMLADDERMCLVGRNGSGKLRFGNRGGLVNPEGRAGCSRTMARYRRRTGF
jgi:ATP-binding cassette subfamily F protein uup